MTPERPGRRRGRQPRRDPADSDNRQTRGRRRGPSSIGATSRKDAPPSRGRSRGEAIWIGGRRAVTEALRAGRAREVLTVRGSAAAPIAAIAGEAARLGVRAEARPAEELDRLAPDHQGVVARVSLPPELGDADLREYRFGPEAIVIVLDGVTDPQNLGAAARSAEAAGVAMLVSRERRAAPVTAAAVRASAGALLHLPLARVTNLTRALRTLQDLGFTVVGLDEEASRTIDDEPCPDGPVAVVVGAEGSGISRLVRETCDVLVALPMRGRVQSLNASASLAAALFAYVLPSRRD